MATATGGEVESVGESTKDERSGGLKEEPNQLQPLKQRSQSQGGISAYCGDGTQTRGANSPLQRGMYAYCVLLVGNNS